MGVHIIGIEKDSIAARMGIAAGDILLSINDNPVTDILDYRFFETESSLRLALQNTTGVVRQLLVKKSRYASLGLEFSTYLMDTERCCKNKCVFCFIDQLPKGMRKSLYFKDDDNRLSFLFGNYITLTNIDQREIERIIRLRISPINVSVHTMNPALRCTMMNNPFAGESLRFLKQLADAGIALNCQLVLCPGLNDGKELAFSLTALMELGQSLQSVACVPVGLSAHREGLYPLQPYTKQQAQAVIATITAYGDKAIKQRGCRTLFPSDEFYLIAGQILPPYEFYEDFPQIENGVGMFRNLQEELRFALEEAPEQVKPRHVSLITGMAAYPLMAMLLDEIKQKWDNISMELVAVENHFFGGSVDVTGLLTGGDIFRALKNRPLYDAVLIPEVTLKADEDIFLDNMGLANLQECLTAPVMKVGSTGANLLAAILGQPVDTQYAVPLREL